LLRNDRSRYFETKKFDDNEIVASKDDETVTSTIRIDRVSGSYLWNITDKRARPTIRGEIWGKCSVVEPGKKF
jgi:hypothetical protein